MKRRMKILIMKLASHKYTVIKIGLILSFVYLWNYMIKALFFFAEKEQLTLSYCVTTFMIAFLINAGIPLAIMSRLKFLKVLSLILLLASGVLYLSLFSGQNWYVGLVGLLTNLSAIFIMQQQKKGSK